MAKIKKSTKRKAVRAAKRHPKAVIAIVIILVVIIAVGALLYLKVDSVHTSVDNLIAKYTTSSTSAVSGNNAASGKGDAVTETKTDTSDNNGGNSGGTDLTNENGGASETGENGGSGDTGNTPTVTTYGDKDLSFHFLELGNNYTGDSTYIKAGDIDILIDAGSRQDSADAIAAYVDQYCTDGKLEYVIATHAHQDHIAGFVSTKKRAGIFERYQCGIIIDFAQTKATSAVYNNYVAARDKEVSEDGATHYTALECCNQTDGAQKVYSLGEGMSMTILYQDYYATQSNDENDHSVCVLFTHGAKNYLLTGDLEEKGEASLVKHNPDLPEVELFKAGHHGSYTASTTTLLSVIKPKIVCVCCCAGAVEYTQTAANTFPSQAFVDRVAPYTDAVYVTTVGTVTYNESKGKYEDTGFASMNGVITVLSHAGEVTVTCSNNNTKLKDTDWFKANRTCPSAWSG